MLNLSYGWRFEVYITIGMQEDDGLGGRRRKKGITAKIKEKLPGHHGSHQTSSATSTIPVYDATGTGAVHHEKKGIMEKIKEKLPGGHH